MTRLTTFLFTATMPLALAAPALAHHSAAAFDTQKQVTVTGTVTQYRFANPHVYITVQVRKDDGSTSMMEVEAGAASVLNALGFNKDSVKVGEVVTIVGNPGRRNPDGLLLGRDLHKRDGTYVPLNIASKSAYEARVNATASSIEGTWFPSFREFGAFLGATRKWELTEKARAAAKAMADPKATTQKDCIPIGAPALMFYPVASTISIQKDRVIMKVDWMDTERIVYLDGRPHPPASQTFLHGHSVGKWDGKTLVVGGSKSLRLSPLTAVGKWDGKTLVVETTNFSEHAMGLSTSIPSSTQKKLIERFTLGADGKTLIYSGTVEDPVYLAKPAEWTGTWEYRPNMPHSNQKCDVEVARRFLQD